MRVRMAGNSILCFACMAVSAVPVGAQQTMPTSRANRIAERIAEPGRPVTRVAEVPTATQGSVAGKGSVTGQTNGAATQVRLSGRSSGNASAGSSRPSVTDPAKRTAEPAANASVANASVANATGTSATGTGALDSSGAGASRVAARVATRAPDLPVQKQAAVEAPSTEGTTASSAVPEVPPSLRQQNGLEALVSAAPRPQYSTVTGQMFAERATVQINEARQKLSRGAVMVARRDGWDVLQQVAQYRADEMQNALPVSTLASARIAIEEAQDFLGRYGPVDTVALKRFIEAHETQALKKVDVSQLTGHLAADTYFEEARRLLLMSTGGGPLVAQALTLIADSHLQQGTEVDQAIALTCLRAAVGSNSGDGKVANQLGYELLRVGRLDEAEQALRYSLAAAPTPAAWQNLAELYRQHGDLEQARMCAVQATQAPGETTRVAQVVEVSPEQFAQISPRPQMADATAPTAGMNPNMQASAANGTMPNPAAVPSRSNGPQQAPSRMANLFQGWWR